MNRGHCRAVTTVVALLPQSFAAARTWLASSRPPSSGLTCKVTRQISPHCFPKTATDDTIFISFLMISSKYSGRYRTFPTMIVLWSCSSPLGDAGTELDNILPFLFEFSVRRWGGESCCESGSLSNTGTRFSLAARAWHFVTGLANGPSRRMFC